jgi:phosphatidylethanolamine/phosphatidyl-N-methylethanolamine N-methyltransferase
MIDIASRNPRRHIFEDEIRFLKGLISNPAKTGAISPSGVALARRMAAEVDPADELPVLELGPGTGVVTRALLERGVKPERLVAIEYSAPFCRLIADRMPGVTVLNGDAYDLAGTLPETFAGRLSAVVSSLPLLTRPPEVRVALLEDALGRMAPGQPFIQFSYSLFPPIDPIAGRFTVEHSRWIVMNLPPARVWVYRRPQGFQAG